jgi:methylated-DNA-[protein]-cysteine S-methyltransferase
MTMAQQQTRQRYQEDEIETPIGIVVVVAKSDVLVALDFADCRDRLDRLMATRFGPVTLERATDPGGFSTRVACYFGGEIGALQDVPVEMAGTPFQRTVWAALREVQPGSTASYGELAASIGRVGAARAVGSANAINPVALAVPCHRIIGSGGSLTGYAGGIDRKRWLLEHESQWCVDARV